MFTTVKIFDLVSRPDHLLLIVLTFGFVHMLARGVRPGRILVGLAVVGGWVLAVTPVPDMMLQPLEARIPQPRTLPAEPAGLILLGGMIRPESSARLDQPVFGAGAGRIAAFLPLAQAYPNATVLFTGGSGAISSGDVGEATFARQYFLSMGFDPERLVMEDRSRNTIENATFSRALVAPAAGETWILVTSAYHMPRAFAIFRATGWEVIPYPVDRKVPPGLPDWRFDLVDGLSAARAALHEYLGLAFYWWRGDIDAIWPAPPAR